MRVFPSLLSELITHMLLFSHGPFQSQVLVALSEGLFDSIPYRDLQVAGFAQYIPLKHSKFISVEVVIFRRHASLSFLIR